MTNSKQNDEQYRKREFENLCTFCNETTEQGDRQWSNNNINNNKNKKLVPLNAGHVCDKSYGLGENQVLRINIEMDS